MSDSRDIAHAPQQGGPLAAIPEGASQVERMFAQIMAVSTDPNVDAGKMTALVDLQMRMMDYQKAEQFAKAKAAALMEMPAIGKRGQILAKGGGVQSRYSKLEDIQAAVTPILFRHGLVISFEVGQAGNKVSVRPVLTHTSGYIEKGEAMPLDVDTTGSKNSTQGAGSAATYGKRHQIIAALNLRIIDGDDDGQAAGGGRSLTQAQSELIDDARSASMRGAAGYLEWFKALDAASKGWLVMEGEHDRCKTEAGKVGA
jgi:hypothetical protein